MMLFELHSAGPEHRCIRALTSLDLAAVHAIDRRIFSAPWSLQSFKDELAHPDTICLVAELDGTVVGYFIARRFVDTWHLMTVGVDIPHRRKAFASALIEAYFAVAELEAHRGHTLEVRVSNSPAIGLYKSFGFIPTGVRPRYFRDNNEDALIMWKGWEGEPA